MCVALTSTVGIPEKQLKSELELQRLARQRSKEEYEMAFPFITTPNFLHWAESRRFTNSLLRELGQEWPLGDMPGYVYQDKAWIGLYRTTQGRLLYFMDVPPTIHITEDQTEAEAWVWEHFSKFQQINDKFEQGLRTNG